MAQAPKATKLPEPQQTMTWEEFQATFGDALTAPVGNPNFPEMRPVPDARKRGKKGKGGGETEAFKPLDLGAPPPNRSVGGVRGKNETRDEMDFRMDQGIPRGSRRGGATQGLSQYLLMNQGGMGAEEARLKSNIVASRGGSIELDDKGRMVQRSATARRAPQSSTGRNYDPVAERAALMERGRAAVDMKKREQLSEQMDLNEQFEASQVPGTMRGFANEKGWGQGKTVLKEGLAPGMVTEGRNFPVTNKITEVVDWMKKDQRRK